MQVTWQDTSNQGVIPYIEEQGRRMPHLDGEESAEALSLWEGIAGYPPAGRIAFWRWKRGLTGLRRRIVKTVAQATVERASLSA